MFLHSIPPKVLDVSLPFLLSDPALAGLAVVASSAAAIAGRMEQRRVGGSFLANELVQSRLKTVDNRNPNTVCICLHDVLNPFKSCRRYCKATMTRHE